MKSNMVGSVAVQFAVCFAVTAAGPRAGYAQSTSGAGPVAVIEASAGASNATVVRGVRWGLQASGAAMVPSEVIEAARLMSGDGGSLDGASLRSLRDGLRAGLLIVADTRPATGGQVAVVLMSVRGDAVERTFGMCAESALEGCAAALAEPIARAAAAQAQAPALAGVPAGAPTSPAPTGAAGATPTTPAAPPVAASQAPVVRGARIHGRVGAAQAGGRWAVDLAALLWLSLSSGQRSAWVWGFGWVSTVTTNVKIHYALAGIGWVRALGETEDYAFLLNALGGIGGVENNFFGVAELSADLRLFRYLTVGVAARVNSVGGTTGILSLGLDIRP